MEYLLKLKIQKDDKISEILYNPSKPSFRWLEGNLNLDGIIDAFKPFTFGKNLKEVRLVLGHSCNYRCSYCHQIPEHNQLIIKDK